MARTLSATLEEQQKWGLITWPYVIAKIRRRWGGVIRYDWENLYSGAEYNGRHCAAMPGDGSLIRLRVTESADSSKLYYQRITSPDENSDYSAWTYTNMFDVIDIASCAYETEVAQFEIDSDRKIWFRESTDNGANWGAWTLLGYSPTTAIYGMDTAYKPNGDIALFYIDQATVYLRKRLSGVWQDAVTWDKTTGDLTGISVFYNTDWNLVISGVDTNNNPRLWSLIYGDGGQQAAGTWSDLEQIMQRLSTEPYTFARPCVRRPDTTRLFFVENFTQAELQNRIWYSHSPPGDTHDENTWLEPVPMNIENEQGLAFTQHGSYAWLTNANTVFRALATDDELDITSRLLEVSMNQMPDRKKGTLKLVLDNTGGWYNDFARLGDEVTIGLGYKTSAGNEYSLASSFWITKYKLYSPPWYPLRMIYPVGIIGTLILETEDVWSFLKRHQTHGSLKWAEGDKSIVDLLKIFFARAGLELDATAASDTATNLKPEFTMYSGRKYYYGIKDLLKLIPDQLVFRESKVLLRNPAEAEAVDWTYHSSIGNALLVYRGQYGTSAWNPNRVEIWGDTFMKQTANWPQIAKVRDRVAFINTPTYPNITRAGERADAEMRKAEILTGEDSWMTAPVNCGLEPWDVIQITDLNAGVTNIKRRVRRLKTYWNARHWAYQQTITLGAD